MEGPTSTRAITIQVKSIREQESASKRARIGFQTGLPMFRHPYQNGARDKYNKWIIADDALQLFEDRQKMEFVGISFITDRENAGFKTCAIGGVVNAFNTGQYPIYQFDTVYAVVPDKPEVKIIDGIYTHKDYNPSHTFYGDTAIICTQDSILKMFQGKKFTEIPNKYRLGVAMSTVKTGPIQDSHLFSILLDKPTPKK